MLPLKPGEEETAIDHSVARIIVSLLQLKSQVSDCFEGRKIIKFAFSGLASYKDLNAILAYWINERQMMDQHVTVIASSQIRFA